MRLMRKGHRVWEKMSVSFLALYHTWLFSLLAAAAVVLLLLLFRLDSSFSWASNWMIRFVCIECRWMRQCCASCCCCCCCCLESQSTSNTVCARSSARASVLFLPSLFYLNRVYKMRSGCHSVGPLDVIVIVLHGYAFVIIFIEAPTDVYKKKGVGFSSLFSSSAAKHFGIACSYSCNRSLTKRTHTHTTFTLS